MLIIEKEINEVNKRFSIKMELDKLTLCNLLNCQTKLDIQVCLSTFMVEAEKIYQLPIFERVPFKSKKMFSYIIEFIYEAFKLGKEITFMEIIHEGSSVLNKIYVKTGNGFEDFIRGHIWCHNLSDQMRTGQEGIGPEKNYNPISVEEFEILRAKILKTIEGNKLTKEEIFLMTGSRSQAMYRATSNYSGKKTGFINSQKFYDKLITSLKYNNF